MDDPERILVVTIGRIRHEGTVRDASLMVFRADLERCTIFQLE